MENIIPWFSANSRIPIGEDQWNKCNFRWRARLIAVQIKKEPDNSDLTQYVSPFTYHNLPFDDLINNWTLFITLTVPFICFHTQNLNVWLRVGNIPKIYIIAT